MLSRDFGELRGEPKHGILFFFTGRKMRPVLSFCPLRSRAFRFSFESGERLSVFVFAAKRIK